MKKRKPLGPMSDVPEEIHFARADARLDAVTPALGKRLREMHAAIGGGMNKNAIALAIGYGSKSAIGLSRDWTATAAVWRETLAPETAPKDRAVVQKAKAAPVPDEAAEMIDAAVEAGIELGLQTLPEDIADYVDVDAAARKARAILRRGQFARSLDALQESQRGLERLVTSGGDPKLAVLRNPDRLISMFGLNSQQADRIARVTAQMVDDGVSVKLIERRVGRMAEEAIQSRMETIAQTLGREALGAGQQALYDQAREDGLLDEERYTREWVTRGDALVCDRCWDFDGARAGFDEDFESLSGEFAYRPEIHPRGRCSVRIVDLAAERREKRAKKK